MKNYQQLLTEIYQQYNPEKLDEIPKFLEKYAGREEELLQKVRDKYNIVTPDQSAPDKAPMEETSHQNNIETSENIEEAVDLEQSALPSPRPEIVTIAETSSQSFSKPINQPPVNHQTASIPPLTASITSSYTSADQKAFPIESANEKTKNKQLKLILIGVSILVVLSAVLGYWFYNRNNEINTSSEMAGTEINSLLDTAQKVQVDTVTVGSDNFPLKYGEAEFMGDSPDQEVPETDETFMAGAYLISTLGDGRAFFHNEPSEETQRQAFVVDGDVVEAIQVVGEYVYVEFTNAKGKVSKGWIKRIYLVEGDQ